MKNRVITISRQFGSGGRTVGKLVAASLNIPCYDQEIIEKISQKSGLSQAYIADKGEDAAHGSWFANAFTDRDANGLSTQDYLWRVQRKVILGLAEKSPCVIVGRCADYILKDAADCLKVFVHASMEKRAERIVRVYGEREETPEKRLKNKDKRRRTYYQYYTDMEWGLAQNYHISLDSGLIGVERCAEIIINLYRSLGQEPAK